MSLFNYWKKEDQFIAANKSLWVMIVALLIVNLFLAVAFMRQPSQMTVYIPPDIDKGGVLSVNDVPKSTVFSFAFQIFSGVNSWSHSGLTDYSRNIDRYRHYFSPEFIKYLRQDQKNKSKNGALTRQRMMAINSDHPYTMSSVEKLGDGSWRVHLKVNIIETVNNSVIKDVEMDYPLMVTQQKTSIQDNPWGLVISRFFDSPYRIKTNI